jgi:hypothetical protein
MRPSRSDILARLTLDRETGELWWRSDSPLVPARMRGQKAGATRADGYRAIHIGDKPFMAHHIIWYLEHGVWPEYLDHKDRDRSNNRLDNLREANPSKNQWNKGIYRNNTSGAKGVYFDKKRQLWRVWVGANRVKHHVGRFKTLEEARAAYCAKAAELHGDFLRVE